MRHFRSRRLPKRAAVCHAKMLCKKSRISMTCASTNVVSYGIKSRLGDHAASILRVALAHFSEAHHANS
jgi:hypothetical protein